MRRCRPMPTHRRKAPHLPRAARVRLLRHPQSLRRRQRTLSPGARLQGAGDDQRRLLRSRRASPTAASPRDDARPYRARSPRRPTCRSTPISTTASPTSPRTSPKACGSASRPASPASRSRTRPATRQAALRLRPRGRAGPGGARGDRRGRRRRASWSARAECFLVGQPDLDETHPAARGLCRGRRRLPLRAGRPHAARRSPRSSRRWRRSRSTCSSADRSGFTVADLAELGVRRISVGGALARAAWARPSSRGARDRRAGQLSTASARRSRSPRLNGFFTEDVKRRPDR